MHHHKRTRCTHTNYTGKAENEHSKLNLILEIQSTIIGYEITLRQQLEINCYKMILFTNSFVCVFVSIEMCSGDLELLDWSKTSTTVRVT